MSDTVRSLVVDARDRLDGRELQFLEDTAVEAQWNFVAAGWAAIDSYTTLPFVDRAVSTRLREAVAPELRFLRSTDAYAISYNTTGVALMVRGGHGLAVRARAVLPSAGTIHAAIAEAVVPIIDRLPSMAILSARNPGVTMNALAHQAQQLHALLAEFQAGAGQLRGMSAFVRRSTLAIATNGTRMIITVKSDALARHPQAVAEARQFLSTLTGLPLSDIFVGTVQHAEVAGQVLSGGATVIGVSRMVCPACVRWFWGNGRLVDLAPMVPFSRWLLPP